MARKPKPIHLSTSQLREILNYDQKTGRFSWRSSGKQAGTLCLGYVVIGIDYKIYRAHRLAFVWMGQPVPDVVDHIDRNRCNNAWLNLRPLAQSDNVLNAERTLGRSLPHYIYANPTRPTAPFMVRIPSASGRPKTRSKSFSTLDDAVRYRDTLLKSNSALLES